MKNNKIRELQKELADIKKEDLKVFEDFSKAIDDNIEVISKYTYENCEDILVNMCENYEEIYALENNITQIKELIRELYVLKNQFRSKETITIEDIYDELANKIMMIYFGASLMISLNASDVLDFIKE